MAEQQIQIDNLKVEELRSKLEELGLAITGTKPVLQARLRTALLGKDANNEDKNDDEHDPEDDNDDKSDEGSSEEEDDGTGSTEQPRRRRKRTVLTFRDVEESLEKFSGDNNLSITRWLEEFEEMADLCEWENIQKVAYAKRLLTGSARSFVRYEKCAKSWKKLKSALKDEFEDVIDSYEVHRELSQSKKKSDESSQEYIYRMLEIAGQADIDKRTIIKYIIAGVPDDPVNKAVLHGARTIRQLKEKFSQYDSIKNEMKMRRKSEHQDEKSKKSTKADKPTKSNCTVRRCHNCGSKEHLGTDCPDRSKGTKCFKCNGFGHIAANCKEESPKIRMKEANSITREEERRYVKEVAIKDNKFTGLIDTGSDLTLMRSDEYVRIGSPCLSRNFIKFDGIGSKGNETLGDFTTDVIIDNISYSMKFHVVPGTILKHSVLIGTDFLNKVSLNIEAGEIKMSKIINEAKSDPNVPYIFNINIIESTEQKQIDLNHVEKLPLRNDVKKIVDNYQPNKIREVGVSMKLILKDEVPVYSRPRRLSPNEKNEVDDIIKTWVDEGIVQPSNSEWASPVVLVKKKNGSTRVCIDYRALNKKVIKDRYPLPLIEDQLDALQSAKIFSTLDLRNGFFHVPIDVNSRKYTSFVTPTGQYEFLKVPFGLCNSPSVFQRFINAVFKDLLYKKIVLAYLDDLIVIAKDYDEAVINLKQVLEVASQHGLLLNWSKCKFLQQEIEYLGHIVAKGTVKPSEHKTNAVIKFPKPGNIKDVQSFLGLTGYFRKYIPRYSFIARPLTNLLKNNVKFKFASEEVEAFNMLKSALCTQPVLKIYCEKAETELHTDASRLGYGAILMQRDPDDMKFHPVYFASGKTTPAEEKYSSYELEVLAIVNALKKFRVYLLGIPFTIVTDCQAFQMTMNKKDLCVRVARWALLLEEFQYTIVHRAGKQMSHVDALSRNPLPHVMLLSECEDTIIIKLKRAQREDKQLNKIFQAVNSNKANDYELRNDLLYKVVDDEFLIVVPNSMQLQIIRKAHERGHFGVNKTEAIVKRDYWFKNMRQKIENVVKNCIDCILAEKKQGKQEGLLNVINKGNIPLDTYHIDHLGPIPSTKKSYRHIFVVVDAFSKFVWLYATRSTDTAEVIDKLKKQSAIFGNPRRLISDRGTAFTSNVFSDYCKEEKIEHILITTGVPRSNGQVERVNRTIIPLLSKLASPKSDEWYKYLIIAQKYLNATPSRSTGKTPFKVLFGTEMRLKDDLQIREMIEEEWVKMFEEERDLIRVEVKEQIRKVQEENRKTFNKHRKNPNKYKINDLVAIKRTQLGPGLKLQPKYFGPYSIKKVLRNDRYVVEKIGNHEGPRETSTAAEYMKIWSDCKEQVYNVSCEDRMSICEDEFISDNDHI